MELLCRAGVHFSSVCACLLPSKSVCADLVPTNTTQIDVMHAYIDLDRYAGLTIDNALRRLLAGFRLPGESQKIDRIMEKFAERYCKDNPAMFRNAGDAYILSFAIIMLNTDAHNPMAERRLANTDFILMNQTQVESGDFEPVRVALCMTTLVCVR